MDKHTPEPWTVGRELASAKVEITSQPDDVTGACTLIADVHKVLQSLGGAGARDANARRIVACVNACAGIPTETLEAGALAALLAFFAAHRELADGTLVDMLGEVEQTTPYDADFDQHFPC